MTVHALCIHAHFYQPSREDPLTGEIPQEKGAFPYQNWNEKIHAQCYKPNADLGNFELISFDLGPTLSEWMSKYDPQILNRIIEADKINCSLYGVGNAMAQPYHHTILPLGTREDKITQIRWGIIDFEKRYGRTPQGMWFPETAIDEETLETAAEAGIEYTILAPWQAVDPSVDCSKFYTVGLKKGLFMDVFFYEQGLSALVSFDPQTTSNAERFAKEKIQPIFQAHNQKDQIMTIATDGELYGHHQPFRDKFLAYLMNRALKKEDIETTFPALWRKKHPSEDEIKILPNTSWSCHHGIARWSTGCDCTPHSQWKGRLRKAMDRLAGRIDQAYLEIMGGQFANPWEIRHEYLRVKLQQEELNHLVARLNGGKAVSADTLKKMDELLKVQFDRQRMMTSCGWFFDDFYRIEPQNNVKFAAQAVWRLKKSCGIDLLDKTVEDLKSVHSTTTNLSGSQVFLDYIQKLV